MLPYPGLRVIVRSTHVDALGHLNNARYLEFMEWARFDWSAHHGMAVPAMVAEGTAPVVVKAELHFRRECRLDEALLVTVRPVGARRAIGRLEQDVIGPDGELRCRGLLAFVVIDVDTRRIVPLPSAFLALVAERAREDGSDEGRDEDADPADG